MLWASCPAPLGMRIEVSFSRRASASITSRRAVAVGVPRLVWKCSNATAVPSFSASAVAWVPDLPEDAVDPWPSPGPGSRG